MSSGASTTGAGRGLQDYSRVPQPGVPGPYQGAPQGTTGMYQPGVEPMAMQSQMQPFGVAQTGMYQPGVQPGMAQAGAAQMGGQPGMYQPGMSQPGVTTSPQMRPFGMAQPAVAGANGMYQTRPMPIFQQPQAMGGLAGQRQYGQGMNGMYGGY